MNLRLHRNPQRNSDERRTKPMEVIALVVSILGLVGTAIAIAIGYQIGKDSNKTQK